MCEKFIVFCSDSRLRDIWHWYVLYWWCTGTHCCRDETCHPSFWEEEDEIVIRDILYSARPHAGLMVWFVWSISGGVWSISSVGVLSRTSGFWEASAVLCSLSGLQIGTGSPMGTEFSTIFAFGRILCWGRKGFFAIYPSLAPQGLNRAIHYSELPFWQGLGV